MYKHLTKLLYLYLFFIRRGSEPRVSKSLQSDQDVQIESVKSNFN